MLAANCRSTPASQEPSVRAGECLLFRDNHSAVLGMDVGASVSLGDGRSMFIFGDTFLGKWKGDGSRDVTGAVHSATAIVDDSAFESCFSGGSFSASANKVATYLEPKGANDGEMVWPIGPALVQRGRIELLYTWVKNDPTDGLGFKTLGNGIVSGDLTAKSIPVDVHALSLPASEAMPSAWVAHGDDAYLYRCGPMLGNGFYPCIVGKAPLTDSDKTSDYTYYVAGKGYVGVYSEATIVTEGAPAFSVTWNAYLGAYLEIYIEPFGSSVSAKTALAPEGPFTGKVALWPCSLPKDDVKANCYAAFEHSQLDSQGGETVAFSYSTNTDLGSMVRHPNLYWPRLAKIDLSTVGLGLNGANH